MEKLSKKQMSSIIGGSWWFCTYKDGLSQSADELDPIGTSVIVEANSAVEAADIVHASTGSTQVNCTAL